MKINKTLGISIEIAILLALSLASFASALTISDISVSPNIVVPGETFTISIDIKNNFDFDVQNVNVNVVLFDQTRNLILPFSPEKASTSFFDEIQEDKSRTASFELRADSNAASGVYKIPISISYMNVNQTITETTLTSVSVNAKPVLGLSINSVLMQNQKNKLQIQISNTGLGKASFLEINLGAGSYDLLSGNNVYIGDLDSNDFNTASFDVYLKNSPSISIPLTVKYKDSVNKDYEGTFTLTSKVYNQQEALQLGLIQKSNVGVYVFLVVILVVLYVIYSRLRKWMKNRKNKENGK